MSDIEKQIEHNCNITNATLSVCIFNLLLTGLIPIVFYFWGDYITEFSDRTNLILIFIFILIDIGIWSAMYGYFKKEKSQ